MVFEEGLQVELEGLRRGQQQLGDRMEALGMRLATFFGAAAVIVFLATPVIAALASHYFGK